MQGEIIGKVIYKIVNFFRLMFQLLYSGNLYKVIVSLFPSVDALAVPIPYLCLYVG
jgi:hypothetical protein